MSDAMATATGENCTLCCAQEGAASGGAIHFFTHLFDTSSYPPRWQCGSWTEFEGWFHIVSDVGIAAAYFAIPCAIAYFLIRRRDIPFHVVFLLFAAFILFCGAGHALDALIFWQPVYRFAGLLKAATAIVSWATFFVLVRYLPMALSLPGLATVNERLRRADEMKTQFLANMSHEIRTPMTAILGFVEVLAHSRNAAERRDAEATIKRNGEHLLQVLNDILDLSKIEAGKLKIEQMECRPREIVDDVARLMAVRAQEKKLRLEVQVAADAPEVVRSDPTRLRQVLLNLVGNAIKFTEQGSVRIDVRTTEKHNAPVLEFAVTDTGVGMDESQTARIFESFNQGDDSVTRRFGGVGLGLAISKRMVGLLGGEIAVESKPGEGSCFRFHTPLSPHETIAQDLNMTRPEPPARKSPEADPQWPDRPPLRVLIVEDGPDNQRLLKFLLKKWNMNAELAEHGARAVDMVFPPGGAAEEFDAILMDMQMPVMDGYTAVAELRRRGYEGPVIALTAHAMQGDREKCLNAGCDSYLCKPIDHTALRREIETLARRNYCGAG